MLALIAQAFPAGPCQGPCHRPEPVKSDHSCCDEKSSQPEKSDCACAHVTACDIDTHARDLEAQMPSRSLEIQAAALPVELVLPVPALVRLPVEVPAYDSSPPDERFFAPTDGRAPPAV